jgi:Zn-dependent protease with chaperone function
MRSCSRHSTEAGTERLHKTSFSLSIILHVTYQVSLLFVQFLIGHFSSQHDTLSDILAACVAFQFFFSFLEIFPLLFTKYFFIPLLVSMALGQPNLGQILFSTLAGATLKALL